MEWETAILKLINDEGRENISLQTIYASIGNYQTLTEDHLRIDARWGGRPMYHHHIRSHISNLCQAGLLKNVGRGLYSLTLGGSLKLNETKEMIK